MSDDLADAVEGIAGVRLTPWQRSILSPRMVVLLCGPPGAGKSTLAHFSGLTVYDGDDYPSERAFSAAIASLRTASSARAVVIRYGATSSSRRKTAALIGATHVYLVAPPPALCEQRVRARRRGDLVETLRGIGRWFDRLDRRDGVPDFPTWDVVFRTQARTPPPFVDQSVERAARKRLINARDYGYRHKATRERWRPLVESGTVPCSRCGLLIAPGAPWHLDHDDHDRSKYRGPSHESCNVNAPKQRPASPAPRPTSTW